MKWQIFPLIHLILQHNVLDGQSSNWRYVKEKRLIATSLVFLFLGLTLCAALWVSTLGWRWCHNVGCQRRCTRCIWRYAVRLRSFLIWTTLARSMLSNGAERRPICVKFPNTSLLSLCYLYFTISNFRIFPEYYVFHGLSLAMAITREVISSCSQFIGIIFLVLYSGTLQFLPSSSASVSSLLWFGEFRSYCVRRSSIFLTLNSTVPNPWRVITWQVVHLWCHMFEHKHEGVNQTSIKRVTI